VSTIDELIVRIDADTRGLRQGLDRATDSTRRANQKMGGAFDSTNKSIERVSASVKAMSAAIAAAGVAAFARGVINAGLSVERIDGALRQATGSAKAAANEFAFVRREAARLGLDLEGAATQYSKLAAAARGTAVQGAATREIFTAISEASTVLRLSAAQTQGALTAVEQIISKGTVSAEELRGQLGERLPGAFQIAARAMGVTTQELGKMLEQGEVIADDFLPKFAAEMRRTFEDQVPQAVRGAQASINRFQTAIFDLQVELASSGVLDSFVDGLEDLRAVVEDPAFREGMRIIAEGIALIGTEAANAVRQLGRLADPDTTFGELLRGSTLGRIGVMLGVVNEEIKALGDESSYRAPESVAALAEELDNLTAVSSGVSTATKRVSKEDEKAAEELAKRRKAAADFIRDLTNENRVLDARIKAGDKAADQLEREIAQREALGPLYNDNLDALNELNAANDNLTESLERQQEAQEELEQAAKKAAREMERDITQATDSIVDALEGVLFDGEDIFGSLANLGKTAFREIAREAIIRPIVQPIVGGAAGGGSAGGITVPGFSGGTISVGGGGGIGGILSGGGGIFDIFSGGGLTAPSGFASDFIFSGLGQSLGFSSLGAGGMGPAAPTALGSAFGRLSSPAGMIGGFAGNLLGNALFGSDRGPGASIGSSVGAIAGSFIPIPGVGSFLGSVAGNFLGGLFGEDKNYPFASAGLSLDRNGRLVVSGSQALDEGDASAARAMAQAVADQVNALLDATGGSIGMLTGGLQVGRASGRDGDLGEGFFGGGNFQGFNGGAEFTSLGSAEEAVAKTVEVILQRSTFNNLTDQQVAALQAGDVSTAQEITSATQAIDALREALDASTDPISRITAQFEDLRAAAVKYGLDVATVDRALQTELDRFNLGVEGAALAQVGNELGAIQSFQLNRQLGASSTPLDRVAAAQEAVQASLEAVRAGESGAVGGLLQNADTLLRVGADAFGTATPQFAALEKMVDSQVANAAALVGSETAIQDRIAAAIEAQTASNEAGTEALRREVEGLRADVRNLSRQLADQAA
jgi:tape measure domain-containing protein